MLRTYYPYTHSLARSFACSHTRTLALADDHISVCVSCMPDESSVFVQFALLTKLWFLTSRVLIETLRSSVVCCARYCEVCLFFVRLFVCFDCCALAVFSQCCSSVSVALSSFGHSVVICALIFFVYVWHTSPIIFGLVVELTIFFSWNVHNNLLRIDFDLDRGSCARNSSSGFSWSLR